MAFENDMYLLRDQIANAQSIDELNYLRNTNEKKYWWTSIFIVGLFYALNGDVGKMVISWVLSFVTLGIYGLYIIYTSYRDEKEFNDEMEYLLLQKTRELRGEDVGAPFGQASSPSSNSFHCPNCGYEVDDNVKFCPGCGNEVTVPETRFCTYCGAKVIGESKFCPECGKEMPAAQIPESVAEPEVEEEAEAVKAEVIDEE